VYGGEKSLEPAGVNTGPHERRSVEVSGRATLRWSGWASPRCQRTSTRKNK